MPREVAAVAAVLPPELIRTAPHGAAVHGTDHGAEIAKVTAVHCIGTTATGR
jgi:hypothetical protein